MNKLKVTQNESSAETPRRTSSVGRRLIVWLLFLIVLLVLAAMGYLAYQAYISPEEKLHQFNEAFNPKPHPVGIIDYKADAELFRIKKEEAFLKSKVDMLATDSIYLAINLKDSLLSIEIQGVALQTVKIAKFRKSGIFDGMDGIALINQFSSPFKIDSMFATIEKDPFILKMAPKDTIEAQNDVSIPDTARSEPVLFSAYLNKGILLQVSQSEIDESKAAKKYLRKKRYESTLSFIKTAMELKTPEYQPFISVEIPAKDARAIYRALPKKALIAIRLE